ncbi:secretory protein [Niastella vici]|uniref:Secretory protein n=1 Tax=Niastella vici TaxID=1703345 RepID=A0A1V9FMY4_9BACT|nr:basic secretory protein-like protein [Niastella vici]OQP59616.1 secretory protein [Niastella vici]
MKAILIVLLAAALAVGFTQPARISGLLVTSYGAPGADTITREGYTLLFYNLHPGFDTSTRRRLIDAFFQVYPIEVRRFNAKAARKVIFTIDPNYDGVAETSGNRVRISPLWLKAHPEDIDVVTHEAMHIVQNYTHPVPGWLTEGIADYARYTYGINNHNGNWWLPDFSAGQHYTNAYRVTARFFVWLEKNQHSGIIDSLDKAARAGEYTPQIWTKLTGKTVDGLWQDYSAHPQLELTYR